MELTKTPISDVIKTGSVENSELAEMFFNDVKASIGLNIKACYMQASLSLIWPKPRFASKKMDFSNPTFVNRLCIDAKIQGNVSDEELENDIIKKEMISIFLNDVQRCRQEIEYKRSYCHDEMIYYGWYHSKVADWDYSKVVYPKPGYIPLNETTVAMESLDRSALWHYMVYSLKRINRIPVIQDIGKVYCGWDDNKKSMNLYVILTEYCLEKISKDIVAQITCSLFSEVKKIDALNILDEKDFAPIYTSWNWLSDELQNSFIRDKYELGL